MPSPRFPFLPPDPRTRPTRLDSWRQLKPEINLVSLVWALHGEPNMPGADPHWRCPLPGHDDRTPSFHVVPGGRFFKCHGCGRHGDGLDLAAARLGLDSKAPSAFAASLGLIRRLLARGVDLRNPPPEALMAGVARWSSAGRSGGGPTTPRLPWSFEGLHELVDLDHPAREFLNARGFDADLMSLVWGAGYAPGDRMHRGQPIGGRIVIPVTEGGALVGWQGRAIGDHAHKYWNAPGFAKSRHLYGLDQLGDRRIIVVVEGALDVWSLGAGAVAAFGKTLSATQVEKLATLAERRPAVAIFRDHGEQEAEKAREAASKLEPIFPGRVMIASPPAEPTHWDLRRELGDGEVADAGDLTLAAAWTRVFAAMTRRGLDPAEFI